MTILFLLAALQAAAVPAGLAVTDKGGELCASFDAPLEPGSRVTLVRPDPPQSAAAATVVGPIATCDRLQRASISGPFYRLRYRSARDRDASELAIVFAGAVTSRRVARGQIAVHLDAGRPDVRVRSCASHEGVHLTAWLGAPLTGRRLWHAYFYLGFDVEPSCDPRDTVGL